MSKQPLQVGDTASVWLEWATPRGWYTGTVAQVRPNYNWTDETWVEVRGDDPGPFELTAKEKSVIRAAGLDITQKKRGEG